MIDDSITREAISLITGDRQHDYGDFDQNLRAIGAVWGVLLDRPTPIPAADVARMMCALKLIRSSRKYKRDNYVDEIAYTLMAEALDTRKLDTDDNLPLGHRPKVERRFDV